MKRAALIVTDCDQVEVTDWCAEAGKHEGYAYPSEQLLADLRELVEFCESFVEYDLAAKRIREWLPEEDS